MGRVFEGWYYPKGPDGKHVVDADGKRVRKYTGTWHIEFTDAAGDTRHEQAGNTEKQAKTALKKREGEVLQERQGLPTQKLADLNCAELAQAYLAAQRRHVVPAHLKSLSTRINAVIVGTRAVRVKDLTAEAVEKFLAELESTGDIATRTVNTYLQGVKGLLEWAVSARKIPYNPLASVKPMPELEKRRARRNLTDEQFSKLLSVTFEGPRRRSLRMGKINPKREGALAEQGRRNAFIYAVLFSTGWRVSQLGSMKWTDLDLDTATVFIRAHWTGTKNGKDVELPISTEVVTILKAWKQHHPITASDHVVKIPAGFVRTLDDDLVAAGLAHRVPMDAAGEEIKLDASGNPITQPARWKIMKRDGAGKTIDLHALRHTFGTRLGSSPGADPKTVQTLMQHSSPAITFSVYVHKDQSRMRQAIAAVPSIGATATPLLKSVEGATIAESSRNQQGEPDAAVNVGSATTKAVVSTAFQAIYAGSIPATRSKSLCNSGGLMSDAPQQAKTTRRFWQIQHVVLDCLKQVSINIGCFT